MCGTVASNFSVAIYNLSLLFNVAREYLLAAKYICDHLTIVLYCKYNYMHALANTYTLL